jgi:hypothetical protein
MTKIRLGLGNRRGTSIAMLLVSVGMASGALMLASQLMGSTGKKDMKMRQQGLMTSTHATKIQQAQSDAVLDMIRAEIAASTVLSACFSEIGGTGCATFNTTKPLNIPAAGILTEECTGLRGLCTPEDRVLKSTLTYSYECDATSCKGAKVLVKSDFLVTGTSMKDSKTSWVEIPRLRINDRVAFDFACATGAKAVTALSIKESKGVCTGVAPNSCAAGGTPSLLRVFAWTSSGAANVCNVAPAVPSTANQGYRKASVWTADISAVSMPMGPKGDYCDGTWQNKTTIGKNIDSSGGGATSWSTPTPGKPYPCLIENDYHFNLGPGASGGFSNSCPSNYTSSFGRMGGTSFFDCNVSSSSISCKNRDEDQGRDMDTVIFNCTFNR